MTYAPQPGTIPAKVLAYMHAQVGRQWIPQAELESAVDQSGLSPYLLTPVKHGALQKRHVAENRRLVEYAIGDGKPLPQPEDHDPDETVITLPKEPAPFKPMPALWPPTATTTTPGDPVKPRKATGQAEYADIESMQITDDPITGRPNTGDKYSPLFAAMKLGQSIKCRSEDAAKVAGAMRKWRDIHHPSAEVRAVRRYPADSMGRVWLLAPAKAKAA